MNQLLAMSLSLDDLLLLELSFCNVLMIRALQSRRRELLRNPRRYWVCPSNSNMLGAWEQLAQDLLASEPRKFLNFHRVTIKQFNSLLEKVTPLLQKKTVVREPVPVGLELSLTLRYLTSGESMLAMSSLYRIGKSTVSKVIAETCKAIWAVLQPEFLSTPTPERWIQIADDFDSSWNFPNCVGALAGKIIVQGASNSANHNYSTCSTLLACCDAQCRFISASICPCERESEGGILHSSDFGQHIIDERLPLPPPAQFNGRPTHLRPVFLGDQAFPLLPQLLCPFPSPSHLEADNAFFNDMHSRARGAADNAFGILVSRFRIFQKPIPASAETLQLIVLAATALHNYLRTEDLSSDETPNYVPAEFVDWVDAEGTLCQGQWRQEPAPKGLVPLLSIDNSNPTRRARAVRENFKNFFTIDMELDSTSPCSSFF